MQYYELKYQEELVAKGRKDDPATQKSTDFASKNFRPLYFIHMYDHDPKKIEMSFDLTHYQPQFKVRIVFHTVISLVTYRNLKGYPSHWTTNLRSAEVRHNFVGSRSTTLPSTCLSDHFSQQRYVRRMDER